MQKEKKTISCLHINAQSARNKEDELIVLFTGFKFRFDVIIITGTWYCSEEEVLRLPGYRSYFLNRNERNGGGIMILKTNTFQSDIIGLFSKITTDFEMLTLRSNDTTFSVVYHPPEGNTKKFLLFLDTYLTWNNKHNLRAKIGGDFNIDILSVTPTRSDLYRILESNAFKNVIDDPTRVQIHSSTLIDLFLTNESAVSICSGALAAHISDHLPIFFAMRNKKWQIQKQKVNEIKDRNINSTTIESFASRLAGTDWEDTLYCKDPDQAYETFIEK